MTLWRIVRAMIGDDPARANPNRPTDLAVSRDLQEAREASRDRQAHRRRKRHHATIVDMADDVQRHWGKEDRDAE